MAVLPDYLNLSLLLRISNKQQTDIEYELPDDVRKLEDFQLPEGYTMIRNSLSASATALLVSTNGVLVFLQTSGQARFSVTAGGAAVMVGTMFLFSVGSDTACGITQIQVQNMSGTDAIEYTYITLPT